MTTRTVSDVIAGVVAARSPRTFGIMGNGNAYLVGSLTRRGHEFVKARHESGAMSMAQGHYFSTGEVAAVTTTYGPGYTNTLTMMAEARVARTPIVLVTGAPPSSGRRDFDIDQAAAAAAMGVRTLVVGRDDAAATTERAFAVARREQVPVVVAIPYDLADAPAAVQVAYVPDPEPEPLTPDPALVRRAARLLEGAERPLIIVGRGARLTGAGDRVRELGDRVGALFATSVLARALVASEWDLGIAGGFATVGAAEVMRQADVVLVLGASLNHFQMRYQTLLTGAREIIQVDHLPEATHARVTHFVRGDVGRAVDQLLAEVAPRTGATWRDGLGRVADRSVHDPGPMDEHGPDGRLNPRALAVELDRILPEDRAFVQDGGHFLGWLTMYGRVPDPAGLQHPGLSFHAIGIGFPTAVGAALARPARLTVLTCGDGGGTMALPDLETLVREVPRALVVCFNDSAYAMEVHQYVPRGIDDTAMTFREVDMAAIGAALGARAYTVRSLADLEPVGCWARSGEDGVVVVDAKVSPHFVAEYVSEKVAAELTQEAFASP